MLGKWGFRMLTKEERAGLEELIALKEDQLNMGIAAYHAGMAVNVDALVLISQQIIMFASRLLLDDQQLLSVGEACPLHENTEKRADLWVRVMSKKLSEGDRSGWANAAASYRINILGAEVPEGEAG